MAEETPKRKAPKSRTTFRGAGRVAFLAIQEEVKAAVAAGWPLKEFYRQHTERLAGITYSQFTSYVRRYITQPTQSTRRLNNDGDMNDAKQQRSEGSSKCEREPVTSKPARSGFEFDAKAAGKYRHGL